MVDLLIVSIHGVGTADEDYYDNFKKKLSERLRKFNLEQDTNYKHKGFHYSALFEEEAEAVFQLGKDLGWLGIRKFVIHYLGDALAYQKGISDVNRINYYEKIHNKFDMDLKEWMKEGISEDTPILILAHSLGGYIISNHIWDKQKEFKKSTKLSEMGTLCGMVTFGCNIPILTLGFETDKLFPITLPATGIDDGEHIKWLNIFDKDDALALPLENFYSAQNKEQQITINNIEDVEMNIGNIFVNWNPFSHRHYWSDKSFINYIAQYINELIIGLNKANN